LLEWRTSTGGETVIRRRHEALLVGVGGQGVLTLAQIVAAAAHASGVSVVVGQLHGMSQRGGSVSCSACFGPGESSFLSDDGADAVIACEPLEALRAAAHLHPERTRVVMNTATISAFELVQRCPYPSLDEITMELRSRAASVVAFDARALALRAGALRSLNVVMLGAAAGLGLLPIPESALLDAIRERCSVGFFSTNRAAFALGLEAARGAVGTAPEVQA
jgi:indolepyruvate ferredoxin oxidoreductase beta subunit